MEKEVINYLDFISSKSFIDENSEIIKLQKYLLENKYPNNKISQNAIKYIDILRNDKDKGGIDSFFHEYSPASKEGKAIMALAEGLIRIEDKATANEFMEDQLEGTNWSKHIGKDKSIFVNASAIGLQLAERLFSFGDIIKKLSDPFVRETIKTAISKISDHFVLEQNIDAALEKSKSYNKEGFKFSYDMLGEAARSYEEAKIYFDKYLNLINKLVNQKDPAISIKLSALHPRLEWLKKDLVIKEIIPYLQKLILAAKQNNVAITFDAEESSRLDLTLLIFTKLLEDPVCKGYNKIGLAVQAYNKRASYIIDFIHFLASKYDKIIPIRLVKGAYWDYEIKTAQVEALINYPVFTKKEYTDISYLACAVKILNYQNYIYPQFATHNAYTIAAIEQIAGHKKFEFQLLFGMGHKIHKKMLKEYQCRIYAPIGEYKELLPYLIRRLIENSANSSFIHLVGKKDLAVEKIVINPVSEKIVQDKIEKLPLPKDIYKAWQNSLGMDFGNRVETINLLNQLSHFSNKKYRSYSIINGEELSSDLSIDKFKPYKINEKIGTANLLSEESFYKTIKYSQQGFDKWKKISSKQRCEIINNIALNIENNKFEIISLLIKEAGKTAKDALAEVREAIDYCHYYSNIANNIMENHDNLPSPIGEENKLYLVPRGIFVCISPWNFPVAIFVGQVIAALVTGNSVIAKPANQTTLVATYLVELMHKAGIPTDVLSLLITSGGNLSKYILSSNEIAGVVFTGSGKTAENINKVIANRTGALIPFIAETGGINAMIIDSSALIPQTVDYIISSAFNSSGQRCSACRVIFVQQEIEDCLVKALSLAMQTLEISNPDDLSTDIGSLIDKEAYDKANAKINSLIKQHKLLARSKLDNKLEQSGLFIAPSLIKINKLLDLDEEIFAPNIAVISYNWQKIDDVIKQINDSKYGLTLGIISRIKRKYNYIASSVNVGNIYINRNMIGAVVGVQPFGGMGLSGTGFKAGGRHYLLRFVSEKTITINNTAIGANCELAEEVFY